MPASRAPSDARTQGALGLDSPGATEDAAARSVIAGQAPPSVAGWVTYPLPRSFFTFLASAPLTGASLPKLRLRLGDFFSSRWLFIARRRSSFPVPVTLNRFFAPLCVFVFGICFRNSRVLRRSQHHHHVPAVLQRRRFDLADLLHVLREPHQQIAPPLRVVLLAPPEHDRDLDLRTLIEEALDVALLRVVVVDPDLGPELDLLDVDLDLVLPCDLRFLLLLV